MYCMKKNVFIVLSLVFVMSSCNSTNEDLFMSTPAPVPVEDVTDIQVGLNQLNNSYAKNVVETRSFWGFLRKLGVCLADAAGFIFGGGVDGASKVSELADKYLPGNSDKSVSNEFGMISKDGHIDDGGEQRKQAVFKDCPLSGLKTNEVGYIHNKSILNRFSEGNMFTSTYILREQSIDGFLTPANYSEYEELMPEDKLYASQEFSMQTVNDILEPIQNDNDISVHDYVTLLTRKTSDDNIQKQLKITGQVLEGLQYVDDNDTTYITKAREIIENSKSSKEMKEKLLDAISIANASAKLWVTNT